MNCVLEAARAGGDAIMMKIRFGRRTCPPFAIALTALLANAVVGCTEPRVALPEARADVIVIDSLRAFGVLDRPAVVFLHDKHTEALAEQDQDCETCHIALEDGRLSPRLGRLGDESRDTVMEVYHDRCVSCHTETAAAGRTAGPVTCGECHALRPSRVSSRQPMGFDRSLHDRHGQKLGDQCDLCHHKYDEAADSLIYVKGEETTCRYCHGPLRDGDTPSLSEAAHWACIGCHLPRNDAGPADCAGCHDAERQRQITVLEHPRRLDRGQPNFVLLRANAQDSGRVKVNTVPFPHEEHEDFNPTCRVCHHTDMAPCADCHTLQGSEDSRGVTLQRAMHAMDSDHSCIGCHDRQKSDLGCAGCHSLMEQGRPSEHGCAACHAGPPPDRVSAVEDRYTSMAPFRPSPREQRLSFAIRDIPDSVTVGLLSEKYEPVVFPHRQIVDRLLEYIRDSRIASHFHGHEDVVCQGCHHHSPVGSIPPLCESCHGEPFNEAEPFKPGLYGAYHRQCLGCHQSMHLEKPAECEGCHAEKAAPATGASSP